MESFIFIKSFCKGNGRTDISIKKAGYSIIFQDFNHLNKSQLVNSDTNNKTELLAILSVFEIIYLHQEIFHEKNIVIISECQYGINCIEIWAKNWIKNGKIKTIKNSDIIQKIIDLKDKIKNLVILKYYKKNHIPLKKFI